MVAEAVGSPIGTRCLEFLLSVPPSEDTTQYDLGVSALERIRPCVFLSSVLIHLVFSQDPVQCNC